MDSNMKKFSVKQKCKKFLAFSFPEVRFLIDSSSCIYRLYTCSSLSWKLFSLLPQNKLTATTELASFLVLRYIGLISGLCY